MIRLQLPVAIGENPGDFPYSTSTGIVSHYIREIWSTAAIRSLKQTLKIATSVYTTNHTGKSLVSRRPQGKYR